MPCACCSASRISNWSARVRAAICSCINCSFAIGLLPSYAAARFVSTYALPSSHVCIVLASTPSSHRPLCSHSCYAQGALFSALVACSLVHDSWLLNLHCAYLSRGALIDYFAFAHLFCQASVAPHPTFSEYHCFLLCGCTSLTKYFFRVTHLDIILILMPCACCFTPSILNHSSCVLADIWSGWSFCGHT